MDWLGFTVLLRWCLGWWLAGHLVPLPAARLQGGASVSVVIPARNEEGTLCHLLQGLRDQSLQPLEVIVIDDHSTDRTAAIALAAARDLPLQVLQPPPLPPGWCGKTWALHHGVQASSAELLVFLDADTEPAPRFLESLVAQQQQLGGLVSVQPFHRTERLYEQLSMLFNLVGLMAVPLGPRCGVAFGPAMATSREHYRLSGGHAAVAGKVVEDWFLAHQYEQADLAVSAFIGDRLIAYRMYPGGLRDLVVGFDKNFATAAGEVRWPWMVAVVLWLSGLFWAAWCWPASLLGWPLVGSSDARLQGVIYGAYVLQLLVITRRVGSFRWSALLFPIPVVFFLGVFVMAIVNLERGSVQWKGRRVSTR